MLNAVNQCLEDTLGVGVWPGEAQPEHPRHLGLQQPQLGTREGPESARGQLAQDYHKGWAAIRHYANHPARPL